MASRPARFHDVALQSTIEDEELVAYYSDDSMPAQMRIFIYLLFPGDNLGYDRRAMLDMYVAAEEEAQSNPTNPAPDASG